MSLLVDRGGLASTGTPAGQHFKKRLNGLFCVLLHVVLCGVGCASSGGSDQEVDLSELKLAVLPEVWVTGERDPSVDAAGVTRRALESEKVYTLVAPKEVAPALQHVEDPVACFDDLACIRDVGMKLRADKLALMRIGRLGETVVVRLSMVDVGEAKMENTLQEVVSNPEPLETTVERISSRFVDLIKPDPPWYGRWWVLATAGAVVLGAAGVTTWLLVRNTGPDQPMLIMPP